MTSQSARRPGRVDNIVRTTRQWGLALLVALGAGTAAAQDFESYRFETGLHLEFQSDTVLAAVENVDAGQTDLRACWYLGELDPPEPVPERAFLGHVSFIGLRLGSLSLGGSVDESDGFLWGPEGRYAAENVPVTAGLLFRTGRLDEDDGDDLVVTELDLRVGYWAQSNLEVGVVYASTVSDHPDLDSSEAAIGVYAKTVREIGAKTVSLEAEMASVEYKYDVVPAFPADRKGTNFKFAVGYDFYLDESLSVGGALVSNAGDYGEAEGYGFEMRIQYNHGSALGLRLAAGHFTTFKDGVDDTTSVRISMAYRR